MVDYVLNLTEEQQKMLRDATLHYYIPWRPVWNSNSISTPCRMVFDASMVTATGLSMNDVLAKGRNQMNKLVEVCLGIVTTKYHYKLLYRFRPGLVVLGTQHIGPKPQQQSVTIPQVSESLPPLFPGTLATSIIPYDRTAFVPRPTPQNKWLRQVGGDTV